MAGPVISRKSQRKDSKNEMRRTALALLCLLPVLAPCAAAQSETEPTPQETACANAPTTRCVLDLYAGSEPMSEIGQALAAIAVKDGLDGVFETTLPVKFDLRRTMPSAVVDALIDSGQIDDAARAVGLVKAVGMFKEGRRRNPRIFKIGSAYLESGNLDAALKLRPLINADSYRQGVAHENLPRDRKTAEIVYLEHLYIQLRAADRVDEQNRVKEAFEEMLATMSVAERRKAAVLRHHFFSYGLYPHYWRRPSVLLVDRELDLREWADDVEAGQDDTRRPGTDLDFLVTPMLREYVALSFLAFLAREQGKTENVQHFLERAKKAARQEEDVLKAYALLGVAERQALANKPDDAYAMLREAATAIREASEPVDDRNVRRATELIIRSLVATGRTDDALKFAASFVDPERKKDVALYLALSFAHVGRYANAAKAIRKLPEPYLRGPTLFNVLQIMIAAGLVIPAEEIARSWQWSDEGRHSKLLSFLNIANALVARGNHERTWALLGIILEAFAQYRHLRESWGESKKKQFNYVLGREKRRSDSRHRLWLVTVNVFRAYNIEGYERKIANLAASVGDYRLARSMIREDLHPQRQERILYEIAEHQLANGDKGAARETLGEGMRLAYGFVGPPERQGALARVAATLARLERNP